jgi:hypothetical protein
MKITRKQLLLAVAVSMVTTSTGCTTLTKKPKISGVPSAEAKSDVSFFDRMPWSKNKPSEDAPEPYPNPAKVAATWTPDTLVQTGRTPTRGFGGRVFFYDEKSRPVPVEGTLIVHGFDDSAEDPAQRVKRFEFTPEQFTRHFSQTDLGASYSVWIPWDAIGGTQRRVSMVPSFKTTDGKMIQGVPATIMLPGTTKSDDEMDRFANLSPKYKRYREAAESISPRTSGLATTTIPRRSSLSKSNRVEGSKPAITIPGRQENGSLMASGSPTPSVDVKMIGRHSRTGVMPASAQLPLERK